MSLQLLLTGLVIAAAAAYLSVRLFVKRRQSGCSSCSNCPAPVAETGRRVSLL